MFDIITARNCYYAITHPMQLSNSATYDDWVICIMETCKVDRKSAIAVASKDINNRLHKACYGKNS